MNLLVWSQLPSGIWRAQANDMLALIFPRGVSREKFLALLVDEKLNDALCLIVEQDCASVVAGMALLESNYRSYDRSRGLVKHPHAEQEARGHAPVLGHGSPDTSCQLRGKRGRAS